MIEKMHPHYSINTPASIYDEEALTALELAGRIANKTNEVVEEVNKVRKDTDDFIDKTENKTIPDMVKKEFSENTENGVFDDMIDEYAGSLKAELDHLLEQTPAGSTTRDAEVIDGRYGADRKTYATLGNAIRSQVSVDGKLLKDIYTKHSGNYFNATEQTPENQDGSYWLDGSPYNDDTFANNFDCTGKIFLDAEETYTLGLIPSFGEYVVPWANATTGIMFFDIDGKYLGKSANKTFTTPKYTHYARFNYSVQAGYKLPLLHQRCVIVKGENLPDTYIKYEFETLDVTTKKNAEGITLLKESIGVDMVNLYDSTKQTPDTIDPQYYMDGKPYTTDQFDGTYMCSAPISVKPYTYYTLTLIPAVNTYKKPWYTSDNGVFFYKADGTYLSKTSENTFLTPIDCAYIRFNFCPGQGITLESLNSNCVLVEGTEEPNNYIPFGSVNIGNTKPIFYRANDGLGSIWVYSKFDHANDVVCNLVKNGGNDIFDIDSFGLVQNTGHVIHEKTPYGYIVGSSGDWHAPFIVRAVNNADGDAISSKHFTGGNHDYTNSESGGTPTGRTVSLKFFADGRSCWGSGYANHIRIEWINRVQGYNTKKADGTGREILEERHVLTFDGYKWESTVEVIALEDIAIEKYYGFQATFLNNAGYYHFVGELPYSYFAKTNSQNAKDKNINEIHITDNSTATLIIGIDTNYGGGRRQYLTENHGAFVKNYDATTKAYMNLVDNLTLSKAQRLCFKGYYILRGGI